MKTKSTKRTKTRKTGREGGKREGFKLDKAKIRTKGKV
jgi:hypothetical protein